jgi:GH24 family phage-related lysozyme (muramidase)
MPEAEDNPYIGPRPFERADRPLFFGRDRETQELLSLVVAHRVVLLYASSGAGKTSLVNAGLLPLLEEEEGFQTFAPARVAGAEAPPSGANPFVHNVIANWRRDVGGEDSTPDASLAGFLRTQEHPVDAEGIAAARVVVFDQFEEVFTLYPQHWPLREALFLQIADALADDPLLRVVIAIREDYLAQLDRYAPLLPEGLRTRLRLERLGGDAALTAVTRAVATTRRRYASGVAEQLVGDLLTMRVDTGAGGVVEAIGEYAEPVQLQVACRSLWEALPPDVVEITADHLETFGDVDEVLATFYVEAVVAAAEAGGTRERDLRAELERTFITPGGTRGTVYAAADGTGGIPSASIDELERRHLIRAEFRAGARWLELTHDRLIEPIRASNHAFFAALQRRRWRRLAIVAPLAAGLAGLAVGLTLWLTHPAPSPTVSMTAARLIARFEGMSLKPHTPRWASRGQLFIGADHQLTQAELQSKALAINGKSVPWRSAITREQALALLAQDLVPIQETVNKLVKAKLTGNQLAALISLVYNVGTAPLRGSVGMDIKAGKYDAVPAEMMRWVKVTSGGRVVVLPGLVRRRRAEVALWSKK